MEGTHPKTEPRLTAPQLEHMLIHVLRKPELFTTAKKYLRPDYFAGGAEAIYRVLWEAALKVENESKLAFLCDSISTKPFMRMELEVKSILAREPHRLDDDQTRWLLTSDGDHKSLLYRTYSYRDFDVQHASKLLKTFLRERAVQDELKRAFTNAGDQIISNLPQMLQRQRDLAVALEAVDDNPVESGAPVDWAPAKLNKFPTGIEFIDKLLNGGDAPAETYGILGAFGAGKTSLAVQMLYQKGIGYQFHADRLTEETGKKHYPKECYLFHYEATSDEIRMRLWSSSCTIDHNVLEEFDWDKLTSIKNGFDSLNAYEKLYWKNQKLKGDVPEELLQGERERLESELPRFRVNVWSIDMSGVPHNPARGTGYVPEIRHIVDNHLRQLEQKSGRKHEVGIILIDYAGLVCRRHMTARNIGLDHMRHYVSGFPMACKQELAVPLQCPVWIFHQLAGEANKRTYQAKQHYTDAAESKSFAENLHFCFALGTVDDHSGILLFTTSKARRTKIQTPQALMMEGQFFRLVTSATHVYDPKTRGVVPKDVARGLVADKSRTSSVFASNNDQLNNYPTTSLVVPKLL